MGNSRTVRRILNGKPVIEGAGVHLRRIFGNMEVPLFDPFLMLDDFRSYNPEHYRAGFPWHPHRGIETITCILTGFRGEAAQTGMDTRRIPLFSRRRDRRIPQAHSTVRRRI